VLAVTLDGVDEATVADLIRRDPDNALGHYLRGYLRHGANDAGETLAAFRRAAHCSQLRLYESITGGALFAALDALNLTGRARLCAASWMASRFMNFAWRGAAPSACSTPPKQLSRRRPKS
jgi:hypothetical protein